MYVFLYYKNIYSIYTIRVSTVANYISWIAHLQENLYFKWRKGKGLGDSSKNFLKIVINVLFKLIHKI